MGGKTAVGGKRERPAVKDKFILPADHIDIEKRNFRFDSPADSMRHAAVRLQMIEWRGIERDDDFGT